MRLLHIVSGYKSFSSTQRNDSNLQSDSKFPPIVGVTLNSHNVHQFHIMGIQVTSSAIVENV